jgi:hypothetical protein
VLTLLEGDIDEAARVRNVAPEQRVGNLRELVLETPRATGTFGIEGAAIGDGTTLLLHGDVNAGTTPQLEAVLDGVIALQPLSLTVDLTRTSTVSFDVLIAIARRTPEVGRLAVRLPAAACSRVIRLLVDGADDHDGNTLCADRAPSAAELPLLTSLGA